MLTFFRVKNVSWDIWPPMALGMFTLNDDVVNQIYLRIHDLAIWPSDDAV